MKILLTLALALLSLPLMALTESSPPNILLIIADQHTGSVMTQRGYQYVKTPGLDKIADAGVTFTRAYTTYPVCKAFRKSFMTGLMPSKIEDVTQHQSISMTLKNAGYETAYHGKWHVGETKIKKSSKWHGFDQFDGGSRDTTTMERSVRFIKQKHDKPFFMISSFMNPHDTCELARNMSGLEDDYKDGPVEENVDLALAPPLPTNFEIPKDEAAGFSTRRNSERGSSLFPKHPTGEWDNNRWRQYLYGYDRLVEKVDAHIKKVVDALEEQGLLENTVIIYTSDHGDGHAAHMWNQKMTFYEEAINIPFIVSWKGKTTAGILDDKTLVSNGLDIYPTILKFAGIDVPSSLQGRDLSSQTLTKQTTGKTTAAVASRSYVVSELNQKDYRYKGKSMKGRMVVSQNFKYILFDRGENREQLFDRLGDPGEMKPVTNDPAFKEELLRHRAMLLDWNGIISDDDFKPVDKFPALAKAQ